MTADIQTSIRASRRRVPRSRGALSGLVVVILGLWAALVPFIGPAFDIGYTPKPTSSWHWTATRGWLEVLPGAAAVLGGLLLMFSASRAATAFGGWLAALAGAWLVVGPSLAAPLHLALGRPDPAAGNAHRALIALLFFYATGAAILFFASLALGRVSVMSVRDVRAAERRSEAEEAERRAALEAAAAEQRERERADAAAGRHADRPDGTDEGRDANEAPAYAPAAGATVAGEGGARNGRAITNVPPNYANGGAPQYQQGAPEQGGYPQGGAQQGGYQNGGYQPGGNAQPTNAPGQPVPPAERQQQYGPPPA